MKSIRLGISLALLGVAFPLFSSAACNSGGDDTQEPVEAGTLRMSLTGQTNGTTYRLRNAIFEIAGPSSTLLDSETDPNAATLVATLATGGYTIFLRNAWALERQTTSGFEPVQATLLSSNPRAFEIIASSTTSVSFRFATDGSIVDIGTGDLEVSIEVVDQGDGGTAGCSLLSQTGCAAGEGCYPVAVGESVCAPAGTVPAGGTCAFLNDCAAGTSCFQLDTQAQCLTLCDPGLPSCGAGEACAEFQPGAGACIGDGGGGGACNPVTQTGCAAGEGCYLAGDGTISECLPAGSGTAGAVCPPDGCAPGLVCLMDGNGDQPHCYVHCDVAAPTCGGGNQCVDLGLMPNVGVCAP
jgi:hypothetical protein